MEAVPRLPMISFLLKISPDRFPTDFSKLKQYIREFYNEDPETYSTEIRNLETLRANAVHPAKDATGCAVLKKYFCQLHFLQSRFPIGRDEGIAIYFTWRDTYGGGVVTNADIKFEMVNILYNIGALHSQLGAADDRTTPEGLKMACTHFQCAAWAFQHLKDSFPQSAGLDVSNDLVQFMYHLCLAQAQECILEKSMTDNRKASINAKVAAQIVDYYNLALHALLQGPSDDNFIVDMVSSKIFKNWKKYMKFKSFYYTSIALLYQGMHSEEQQKMGERITYYQAALDKLNEAFKHAKGDLVRDYGEAVNEALIFTRDVVEGKRKAAKNENDFIYHEDIPELDSLPIIKGASLVKGIPFSFTDQEISGPDIFARLVPMKAHEVSSMYSEEKAKLLRKMNALIDTKDEEVVSFMSSLQLEYLRAHLDSQVIPQEVIDRCAALSAKPDAIPNLISAMDKLSDVYHDVDGMLKEIMELIKTEEVAEREYQEVMGPRPPSIVATDLTREANKYMEAHQKAAKSNETLHKAMSQHIENLRVLQRPLDEITSNLPNLNSLNLEEDPIVQEMIMLTDKVAEMRKQRAMLASQLRESICSDDITSQLVTRTDEKKEDIFEMEMQKHNKYVGLIEQNLAAQDNIIPALADAYAKYAPTRKAATETMRQREMMLSALISSYDAYEDLITKSNKGLEFYRKLETNLTKLLQRVKGTCKVQQEERETILAKNNKKINLPSDYSAPTSTPASEGSGLKLKDYLQSRKAAQNARSTYYSTAITGSESQPSWLPSVRPAPLGSEGTSSSKLTDYTPYNAGLPYSAQNTAYGADYTKSYMANYSYQNPLSVDLQNLQYPQISGGNPPVNPASSPSPQQIPQGASQSYSQGAAYTSYDPNYTLSMNTPTSTPPQYTSAQAAITTTTSTSSSVQQYSANPYQYSQAEGTNQNYQTPVNQNYYGSHPSQAHSYAPTHSNYQTPVSQQTPQSYTHSGANPTQDLGSQPASQPPLGSTVKQETPTSHSQQSMPPQSSQSVTVPTYPSNESYQPSGVQQYQNYQIPQNYQNPATQSPQTSVPQSYQATQNYQSPSTMGYHASTTQSYPTPYATGYENVAASSYAVPSHTYPAQPTQNADSSANVNYNVPSTQAEPSVQNYQSPSHQSYMNVTGQSSQLTHPTQQTAAAGLTSQYSVDSTKNSYTSSVAGTAQNLGYDTNNPYNTYTGVYQNPSNAYWSQQGYMYNNANPPTTASQTTSTPTQQSVSGIPAQSAASYAPASTPLLNSQSNNSVPSTLPSIYGSYYADYTNTYPKPQFQDTTVIGASHYSSAGGKSTAEVNSSSVTPEGLTYASQYVASTVPAEYQHYYNSPYGYQYTMPGVGPLPQKPVTLQQPLMQPNSMTYIQASRTGTTMTFSQQQNGGQPTTPTADETKTSNLDLLTGLDFNISSAPPLQPVTPAPVQLPTQAIEQSQEKLANLTLEPKPSSINQTPSTSIDDKPKQSLQNGSTSSLDKIERPSPSKTPIKDPFTDPELLSLFVQEVEKFEKFVEGLNSKTLNGPTPLDIKWNELQDLQDKDAHKQIISVARCYPMKNRFPDFLPFDGSRVELPSTKDDYINASHVKDLRSYTPNFIMTQAPLPSTFADFWTMVIEQHVEIIVCLQSESQMNGEIYWPVNKGEDFIINKVKVSLQSTNTQSHWIERIMSVSDGKISRVVVHLQISSWPQSWMPESPAPFLSLVNEAWANWSQQRGRGPIVVHCDAGVGRSGVFVLIMLAACDLRVNPHLPDPITLAAQLAQYRKNPLRDRAHLTFTYHALLYYCQDLLMKRGILASRSTFDEKRPKTKSHTRHPSEDFLLNSLNKEHNEDRRQSDASSTGSGSRPSENDPLSQIDPLWPIKRFS